jgi:uncharacterized cupredoxin-like copper-binding protein
MAGSTPVRRTPRVGLIFGISVLVYAAVIGAVVVATRSDSGGASTTVEARLSEWQVDADPRVGAGDVTFVVRNFGTMPHEMLVLQTDTPAHELPITDSGDPPVPVATGADKVDEEASVGETGGEPLEPSETRTFVVKDMAPGHYVLLCNLSGHYQLGMATDLTVTP